MCGHSAAIGSFTFMIMSASFHTAAALGAMVAPTAAYSSSGKPLPSPAPCSTVTLCPAAIIASAPAGTSATRFSLTLISFGTPIFMSAIAVECELSGAASALAAPPHNVDVAAGGRPALLDGARTEADDRLPRRVEVVAAHGRDLLARDRVHCRQDLVERPVRLAVQLDRGRAVHA